MSKEAMKLALEALITASGHVNNEAFVKVMMARDALVEALAEQPAQTATYTCGVCGVSMQMEQPAQQEPVATVIGKFLTRKDELRTCIEPELPLGTKLYTTPPAQRTWVGLTDEEIERIFNNWPTYHLDHEEFARVIEDILREKNS